MTASWNELSATERMVPPRRAVATSGKSWFVLLNIPTAEEMKIEWVENLMDN